MRVGSRIMGVAMFGALMLAKPDAQSVNITGSVIDSATSGAIKGALVRLVEFPQCSTRTNAEGAFTLGGTVAVRAPQGVHAGMLFETVLRDNELTVAAAPNAGLVTVSVFAGNGVRTFHGEKWAGTTGAITFSNLWQTPGLYYVTIRARGEERVVTSLGTARAAEGCADRSNTGMAKTVAAVTVEAIATGYVHKDVVVQSTIGNAGVVKLPACQWEDISPVSSNVTTPPAPSYSYVALSNYGFLYIGGANADQPKTIYVGTNYYGIWKSTDGGNNWFHANTGTLGASIDNGRVSPVVDPTNSNTVYCAGLYGSGYYYKSTDGGTDWTNIGLSLPTNDISNGMAMDPLDHNHFIIWAHENNGYFETFDGGASFTSVTTGVNQLMFLGQDDHGNPNPNYLMALGNSQTGSSVALRTTTAGRINGTASNNYRDGTPDPSAWTQIATLSGGASHGGGQLYRSPATKWLYLNVQNVSNNYVYKSSDNGQSWVSSGLPGCGDAYAALCDDGTRIWTMPHNTGCGNFGGYPATFPASTSCGTKGYRWRTLSIADTASIDAHSNWAETGTQAFNNGPERMTWDSINRVLYASNGCTGVFRLKE